MGAYPRRVGNTHFYHVSPRCRPAPLGAEGPAESAPRVAWWPDWNDPLIWRLGFILGGVNCIYFGINFFLPDYLYQTNRPGLVIEVPDRAQFLPVAGFPASARSRRPALAPSQLLRRGRPAPDCGPSRHRLRAGPVGRRGVRASSGSSPRHC